MSLILVVQCIQVLGRERRVISEERCASPVILYTYSPSYHKAKIVPRCKSDVDIGTDGLPLANPPSINQLIVLAYFSDIIAENQYIRYMVRLAPKGNNQSIREKAEAPSFHGDLLLCHCH
jgi:hypothetical protein